LGINLKLPKAELSEDVHFKPELDYFMSAKVDWVDGKFIAQPIRGNGSGDMVSFGLSNAFIHLPIGNDIYHKGQQFDVYQ